MSAQSEQIGSMAVKGIFWSITQSWGGRLLVFLLFIILARFLTPAEFGIANATAMVLLFITMVAEFGFGDAVVQRPGLVAADVNLPFYVSLCVSLALAIVAALSAGTISHWLDVDGMQPVLQVVCFIAPLTTMSQFQEMNYRRNLQFRPLALRVFIANGIAGVISIACAAYGMGVWSLVVQNFLAVLIGLIWLWRRPQWRPSLELRPDSFFQLARFGISVVSVRLIDFAVTRVLEVMIIARYGISVFGLYSAGSRLYTTLMQLLQGALNDVSLTVLARISHEHERMGRIYLQSMTISGFLAAPVFVACAAVAPEICLTLLGSKWDGVDTIARPLLLLGAVQCAQFLNAAYLSARGRPSLTLAIALFKQITVLVGLLTLPSSSVVEMVNIFVLLQLISTPVSFGMVLMELKISPWRLLGVFAPAVVACLVAYLAVGFLREHYVGGHFGIFIQGLILGLAFVFIYAVGVAIAGRKQIQVIREFVMNRLARR